MSGLKQWARELVAIIVLGGLLEMAVPAGAMRRYAQVAIGLLILVSALRPVLDLLQSPHALLQAVAAAPPAAPHGGAQGDDRVRAVRTQIANHAAELFRTRLEAAVVETAREVPGVRAARASVEGATGAGAAGGVQLRVRVEASAPDRDRLAGEVRRRLGERFELPAGQIDVQVGGIVR